MKTKTYRYGKYNCRTYFKKVGAGWETGFVFNGHPVFVGNFIYSQEASRWFRIMNYEITRFGKKYTTGHNFPAAWFSHFIKNHLYKFYYAYLDKLFVRYQRGYSKAFSRDVQKFARMKKKFHTEQKTPYLKSA